MNHLTYFQWFALGYGLLVTGWVIRLWPRR